VEIVTPRLVGPLAIYICNRTLRRQAIINHLIYFFFLPSRQPGGYNPGDDDQRQGGITRPAITDRGYELRSRGPPSLGRNDLDSSLDIQDCVHDFH
jgi:hypothetical protein